MSEVNSVPLPLEHNVVEIPTEILPENIPSREIQMTFEEWLRARTSFPVPITDENLVKFTQAKVKQERDCTLDVLKCLIEIERRRVHLRMGYGSLFDFCIRELEYSESAAFRRISAMRFTADVPEAEHLLKENRVTVSTLSQLQRFVRREEKFTGKKFERDEKISLLKKIDNKSIQDTETELLKLSPHLVIYDERRRRITDELMEYKIVLPQALIEKLDRIKNLLSHHKGSDTTAGLIGIMVDILLSRMVKKTTETTSTASKLIPAETASREADNSGTQSSVKNFGGGYDTISRYIPAAFKQEIYTRDQGVCTYVDPSSGRRCGSKYRLQIDHIIPVVGGGKTELANLRLLCGAHNQWKGHHLGR